MTMSKNANYFVEQGKIIVMKFKIVMLIILLEKLEFQLENALKYTENLFSKLI